MRNVLGFAMLALLCAIIGCVLDWQDGIVCRVDRHCPRGRICVDSQCQAPGETIPDAGALPGDGGSRPRG